MSGWERVRMRSLPIRTVLVMLVAGALSGCGDSSPSATAQFSSPSPSPAVSAIQSPVVASPTPQRLRVLPLLKKAGCKSPKVIGTQLYSYETGECKVGRYELAIAVFDNDKLRDEWVKFGKNYGGNYAIGEGWAVYSDSVDVLEDAAKRLGGKIV